MTRIRLAVLFLIVLLAAPLAAAGSAPSIAFFADSASGPVGDGILTQAWPTTNESSVRPILIELAGPSTTFVDIEEPPGTHLKGRLFAGIWPDAALADDAQLRVSVWLDGELIAEGMVPINIDPSATPDPLKLVPPDPTDPQGAVYHVIGQVLPLVLQPPTLVDLGVVDVEVPNGSALQVGFGLVGAASMPPVGAAMVLKYDGVLTPSFMYMPWWSADPEAVSPQISKVEQAQAPVVPPAAPPAAPPAPTSSPNDEESPGVGLLALVVAVGAAFLLRRR